MDRHIHDRLMTVLGNMSSADLDTLQNDRIGKFVFPKMPPILKPHFRDWLIDYGPGEAGMSHERIHETYHAYYEHIAHDPENWEPQEVHLAKYLLDGEDPDSTSEVASQVVPNTGAMTTALDTWLVNRK